MDINGGGNALVSAIGQRPTAPSIDVDALFTGYEKIKEINLKQQALDEEKKYHQQSLDLAAAQAGLKSFPDPTNPNAVRYGPDDTLLQQKQEAAKAERVKALSESSKIGGIGSFIKDPIGYMREQQDIRSKALDLYGVSGAPSGGSNLLDMLHMGAAGGGMENIGNMLAPAARAILNPSSATASTVNSQGMPARSSAPKGARAWDTVNKKWVF